MPITVKCDGCGRTLRAKDELGGRRGRCPYCRAVITIPRADVVPRSAGRADLNAGGSSASARDLVIGLGRGVEMRLVLIPAGTFVMGSPKEDVWSCPDERPQHQVRITRPFYMSYVPVTRGQYERVMGAVGKLSGSDDHPASPVSWSDAVEFCRKLSAAAGRAVQLPSEAQWEHACRAGTTTPWCCPEDQLHEYAWYRGTSGAYQRATLYDGTHRIIRDERSIHPVGLKKPNAWGLHDMHGNVWEWCADWYGEDYYSESPSADPEGPTAGTGRRWHGVSGLVYERVARGGTYEYNGTSTRSAARNHLPPDTAWHAVGFRVVVAAK